MGGRDGIERQTTTMVGRVAPGKGRVRVHPARVQNGGGAEADTGRRQPCRACWGLRSWEDDDDGTDDDREDDDGECVNDGDATGLDIKEDRWG